MISTNITNKILTTPYPGCWYIGFTHQPKQQQQQQQKTMVVYRSFYSRHHQKAACAFQQWKKRSVPVIQTSYQAANTELDGLQDPKSPKCLVVACTVVRISAPLVDSSCTGLRPFQSSQRSLWLQAVNCVDWTEDMIKTAHVRSAH